jgi:ABC-type nitrate/sulfonate/bicarbonate transport system permease component
MRRLRVVISILSLIAVWQIVVLLKLVPDTYFPSPVATLQALWAGLLDGELSKALAQTALRTLLGLLAATAVGLGLALLTARYRRLRQAFDPVAEFLRPLPPAALVPMAIFFLGLGWKLHGFIVLFACVWPVYLNATSALKAVPSVQMRTAASFGYQGWDRVLHVQLPAALPDIFIGIRIAAGIALIAIIVTEMLAGRDGMGYVMNDAAMTLRIPETFAALFLIMLAGLALNALVLGVRNRIVAWNIGMTTSNRG